MCLSVLRRTCRRNGCVVLRPGLHHKPNRSRRKWPQPCATKVSWRCWRGAQTVRPTQRRLLVNVSAHAQESRRGAMPQSEPHGREESVALYARMGASRRRRAEHASVGFKHGPLECYRVSCHAGEMRCGRLCLFAVSAARHAAASFHLGRRRQGHYARLSGIPRVRYMRQSIGGCMAQAPSGYWRLA